MEERERGSGLSRRRRVALAVLLVLGLALFGSWLARLSIATRFVDRELAARGVPARYTLAGLTPGGQRLENVVIGDPANPDLVADWVETQTGIGLSGPYLDGVRAGRVRINARLVGGRVSLGSLDRLLPPPSGKPFALPRLRVASEDVRIRLATSAGTVGLKLAGEGRLDDGFRGTLAAVAPRLAAGGCEVQAMRASMRIAIAAERPRLAGPLRIGRAVCPDVTLADIRTDLDAAADAGLAMWRGRAALATGPVAGGGASARTSTGAIDFAGGTYGATGGARLSLADAVMPGLGSARAARFDGSWGFGSATDTLDGEVRLEHAAVDPARLAGVREGAATLAGSPVGPLAARAGEAAVVAARDALVTAGVSVNGDRGQVTLARLRVRSASGARIDQSETLLVYDWRRGIRPAAAGLTVEGGGLPSLSLDARRIGDDVAGRVILRAPYAAGGAALAMTPLAFRIGASGGVASTIATVSGPFGSGRVEALRIPLRGRVRDGVFDLNPGCTRVTAAAARVSGLMLDRPDLTLCATGPALVRVAGGSVAGGARLPELRLRGALGSSPLAIDGEGARIDIARRGFAIEGLRTRIGAPGRETRLNFAALGGRVAGGGVAGTFAGGAGRIGAVPLALGEAAGDWRFAGGVLDVGATLVVADTADTPRFQPMRGEGVTLRLENNVIDATGALVEPTTGTRVAGVGIAHALGTGVGHADLSVAGITFRDGFQPELLTRVTFGVIADVRGTMTGEGRIDWSPAGVASAGRFRTGGTDLAAAFGPVAGIAGEIAFDDLLGLRSAPNQRVTVRSINPGIEVTDGVIRFRTLSGTQVEVEDARWPFAGGTLTLQPTQLDFGAERARRMTFVVTGAAADKFLQQFAFDNLQATGTFDGTLPMVFDQAGGRIENGRLTMREGGGTIAYLGDLTQKDLGFWGNLAFRSLRSLRYRNLDLRLNGPLAGEMVTEVKFAGVSQGEGAKSNFLIRRLQRLPFVFNIRIQAPFRGLLDSVQSFYDPKRLIDRNLPALLEAQRRAQGSVQPPASEKVP